MDQGKLYSKHNDLQIQDNLFILHKYRHLLKWPEESISVMDIGTGDGKFAVDYLLADIPKLNKLIAIDVSESMIDRARQRKELSDKVDFVLCDISSPVVPSNFQNHFDYIVSFMCLHWVDDHRTSFENIFNFLRDGASFFAVFVVKNPLTKGVRELSNRLKWKRYSHEKCWPKYQYEHNPKEELNKILSQIGFVDISLNIEEMVHLFPDLDSFDGFVSALNPIIFKIPERDRDDYVNEYLDILRKIPEVSLRKCDGAMTMEYSLFVVNATKRLSGLE